MSEVLKVMVTDDEDAMRMAVRRALRSFRVVVDEVGEEVTLEFDEADCGETALTKIAENVPDILLLDIKMPGMSGLEVLEHVSREYPTLVTIMITAHASIQTAVTATKQGAYDFLAKPFTPEELRSIVEKAVRNLVISRQARRLSDERRRVRFEFIRVLAHELKAPLNAVEGNLNLLEMDYVRDDPSQHDMLVGRSRIRLQGMRKLIMDLLDMTRVESGQKQRELVEVDLVEAARGAMEAASPDADEHGIEMALEAPERLTFKADPGEVDIILNNLVSNAVKYNRDGGKVKIVLDTPEKGPGVRIRVSDTGIGLSRDEAAKLFNDFVRIKNKRTKGILGSGLGLSIVKKLATLYGGEASVESQPDVGSEFTVVLREAREKDVAAVDEATVAP